MAILKKLKQSSYILITHVLSLIIFVIISFTSIMGCNALFLYEDAVCGYCSFLATRKLISLAQFTKQVRQRKNSEDKPRLALSSYSLVQAAQMAYDSDLDQWKLTLQNITETLYSSAGRHFIVLMFLYFYG